MSWNRIGRELLCLLLVAVLLINCSPIRAQAIEPMTMVAVSGLMVLASAVIGLGVMVGDNSETFLEVIQNLSTHEKILPYMDADGNIHISRLYQEDGQLSPWLIPAVLLQVIRQVLFDEEVVVSDSYIPNGFISLNGNIVPDFSFWDSTNFPFSYLRKASDASYFFYAFARKPDSVGQSSVSWNSSISYQFNIYYVSKSSWEFASFEDIASVNSSYYCLTDSVVWSNFDAIYLGNNVLTAMPIERNSIGVADGLVAGEIAPLQQELVEGYPAWGQGQIQDQEENYWLPIGLDQTLEETMRLTQQQVQLGEGTFEQEQDQEQDQTQTQIPGLIQGFQDKVNTWFSRLSLTVSNIFDTLTTIPQQLLTGLQNLFVPDAQMMAQQQEKWTGLLSDRFGAVYDSVALIDNIAGAFTDGTTQTQIRFPSISIPFGDVNWEFGGWMVDVVPDGFESLVNALKLGVDILCTLAFVNAMKHRLDRVLEGRG